MIPFPFNENRFSFFDADHLLVGQLCINPKSDRSLLSCLKVTQCLTSEIGDAPLYNSCSLPIQIKTTGPLPALSKCKSGQFNAWRHSSMHWSWLESQHQSVTGCAEECSDPLVKSGGVWVWQQDSAPAHKSKETQASLQKECYDFVPFSYWPPSSPVLNPLDYFVWSHVEKITNMTAHNTKASLIATIRRVFAELPPALVEKACSQFQIRIEAVI